MKINDITAEARNVAIHIHKRLGNGLLESVYERVLVYELRKRGMQCETQKLLPIIYDGELFPDAFRADIVVEGQVIIEVKSVSEILPSHEKQLMTYLKLSGIQVGLLINFGGNKLMDGFKRIVNNFVEDAIS